jgi:hypothetical protein
MTTYDARGASSGLTFGAVARNSYDRLIHPPPALSLGWRTYLFSPRPRHWRTGRQSRPCTGNTVDPAQGVVPVSTYTQHIPKTMSEVWHANPNGKFVIGELRYSWRGQLRHSGPKIIGFGKIIGDT